MSNEIGGEQTSKNTPRRISLADSLGLFLRGVAMGAADIVPGVSGGTIAFITGVYERFIAALRSLSPAFLAPLARGRARDAFVRVMEMHWSVLIPMGLGIGFAIVTMSRVITGLMENHPGPTYAFFFGLILASAWIPFARMRRRSASHGVAALLAATVAFIFVGLQPTELRLEVARADDGARAAIYTGKIRHSSDLESIRAFVAELEGGAAMEVVVFDPKGIIGVDADAEAEGGGGATVIRDEESLEAWLVSAPPLAALREARASHAWLFLCGVIAISAMILPGLSGAFLLLFLGQYHAVLSAIHGFIDHGGALLGREQDALTALGAHTFIEDFLFLGVFGVGVVIGVAFFSRVVGWLLDHRHDVTMAALTGLMIGALRQPGRVALESAEAAPQVGAYWGVAIGAAFAGAVIVSVLALVDVRTRSRNSDDVANRTPSEDSGPSGG